MGLIELNNKALFVYSYTGEGLLSGSTHSKQMKLHFKDLVLKNEESRFKHNKILLEKMKPILIENKLITRYGYFKLKYFTKRRQLPKVYRKLMKKLGIVQVFASDGFNNLGDILNYALLDYFKIIYSRSTPLECDIAMIGSIVDQCFFEDKTGRGGNKEVVDIWGSGFISEFELLKGTKKEKFIRPLKVHALRGRLSKDRYEAVTGEDLNGVALGDPGLLANKLINLDDIEKKYDVGIVPHYVDANSSLLERIQINKYSSTIIDVTGGVMETLYKIAECRVVLSSAMHGLIVADSFNIPNKWILLSDDVFGEGYKFKDYYSAFDIGEQIPIDLRQDIITDKDIDDVIGCYEITKKMVHHISSLLLNSFPLATS